MGKALGSWQRFRKLRQSCPGCAVANTGKLSHETCRQRELELGTLLDCHTLSTAPAGWALVGSGSLGCSRFFIPRNSVAPKQRERAQPSNRTLPFLEGAELRAFVSALTHAAEQLARTHRRGVEAFYAERGVPFDPRLYCVGPSRLEAAQVVAHLKDRGLLEHGRSHRLPGVELERLSASKFGEAWEFVLDANGERVSWSRRLLAPEQEHSNSPKAKAPAGSQHRVHFSLGWQAAVEAHGVLVITEGVRKANEIARRTGLAALGLPGVDLAQSVLKELRSSIRSARPRALLLAPDFGDMADGLERHDGTRRSVQRWGELEELVREHGGEVRGLAWDNAKGLDDALLALSHDGHGLPSEVRSVPWNEYLSLWRWHVSPSAPTSATETRPRVAPAFEPQQPTRELVRNETDARRVSREIAESWEPGRESLHFAGWPGLGKTSAFGQLALERLASKASGWEAGVAALALPTRELVREKAKNLRAEARQRGLEVEVLELYGRDGSPESDSWCESPRRTLRAQLGRWSCEGCSLRDSCSSEDGRYLRERERIVQRVGDSSRGRSAPVLVVGTAQALRYLAELPEAAPVMLDDVGPDLGLWEFVELRRVDLHAALEHVEEWLEGTKAGVARVVPGEVVPETLVAEFVRLALRSLLGRKPAQHFEALVRGLPAEAHAALAENLVRPFDCDGWPWERARELDGPDLRPALTRRLLEMASEIVEHNAAPIVRMVPFKARENGGPELVVRMPDRRMLERSRAGLVAWLTVAPAPSVVLKGLGARSELVHAAPERLRLVVLEHRVLAQNGAVERVLSFGPGRSVAELQSEADAIVRRFVAALAGKVPDLGAVVSKADHEALATALGGRVVHFGKGHASTDKLDGCSTLVVRRSVPPYAELELEAESWRSLLGLPQGVGGEVHPEARSWGPGLHSVPCIVPTDRLERELLDAHEAHAMLNAIGRSRPLSATSERLVFVLNGRPFNLGGASVTVRQLTEVGQEYGLELELPTVDARRACLTEVNAERHGRAVEMLEMAHRLLAENPKASGRWLAEQLRTSNRTASDLLRQLREPIRTELSPLYDRLRRELVGRGQFGNTSDREASMPRSAELAPPPFPTLSEVREELEAARSRFANPMPERTLKRRLAEVRRALDAGSAALVPARSEAAAGLVEVLRAVLRCIERRVLVFVPGTSAAIASARTLHAVGRQAVGAEHVPWPSSAGPPIHLQRAVTP
jgi:hypothetical protein